MLALCCAAPLHTHTHTQATYLTITQYIKYTQRHAHWQSSGTATIHECETLWKTEHCVDSLPFICVCFAPISMAARAEQEQLHTQSCQLLRSYALNSVNSLSLALPLTMLVAALLPRWVISLYLQSKNEKQNTKEILRCVGEREGMNGGRGGEAKDVRAMQWKLFYAVLGNPNSCLCRFVALSLSSHSSLFLSVRMCVCGCVSLSEPAIHNNNDDATTAWRQNAGWDRVQNFSVPKKKKKNETILFFGDTLVALIFCIFLIISPCRIIVRHIKANLYLHKYFPAISLSFFRFEHSFFAGNTKARKFRIYFVVMLLTLIWYSGGCRWFYLFIFFWNKVI